MGLAQPILGRLDLLAVLEPLAEKAVFIADAIAIGRASHRRHAFHETGRQTAKAAVAKGRVRLILDDQAEILAKAGHHRLGLIAQAQVDRGIFQNPADQEFHRQVIDALPVLGPGAAGGGEPRLDDMVADRVRQRHAPVIDAGIRGILAQGIGQMAQNLCTQRFGRQALVVQIHCPFGISRSASLCPAPCPHKVRLPQPVRTSLTLLAQTI